MLVVTGELVSGVVLTPDLELVGSSPANCRLGR